jgi:hypothetical protein
VPRKPRRPPPQSQAPQLAFRKDLAELRERIKIPGLEKDLAELRERLKIPGLDRLRQEFKPLSASDQDKLRRVLGHPDFRELAASLGHLQEPGSDIETVPLVKPKRRRVSIAHVDEAIDEMLLERRTEPHKFPLVKTQLARVVKILKDRYGVKVPKRQSKTLRRWIADRDRP